MFPDLRASSRAVVTLLGPCSACSPLAVRRQEQGAGDRSVGHEGPEVFPQGGVGEQVLACLRGHDEQGVEQHHAAQGLAHPGPAQAGPSGQERRAREELGVLVGAVEVEHADVLDEDQVAQAGQGRGEDHGQDPDPVHVDPRHDGPLRVLARRLEAHPQPAAQEPGHGRGHRQHEQHHERGYFHRPDGEHPQAVQDAAERLEVDHVADADPAREHHRPVARVDDGAVADHEHELVDPRGQEADHQGGDHLPTLHPVQGKSDGPARKGCQRQADARHRGQARAAGQAAVHGEDHPGLGSQGPHRDGEVQPESGVDREHQGQDHHAVADEAGHHLVGHESDPQAGDDQPAQGQAQEGQGQGPGPTLHGGSWRPRPAGRRG